MLNQEWSENNILITKVGHIAQVYIFFWPHFIIKIHGRFWRSKFACQPISKNILPWYFCYKSIHYYLTICKIKTCFNWPIPILGMLTSTFTFCFFSLFLFFSTGVVSFFLELLASNEYSLKTNKKSKCC